MHGIQYDSEKQAGIPAGYPTDPTRVSSSNLSASTYGFDDQSQQRLNPSHTQGFMMNSQAFGRFNYYGDPI